MRQVVTVAECFICKKSLESAPISTVKERGMRRLLSAIIERGEKDHEKRLGALHSVIIHTACWLNYTREQSFATVRRRQSSKASTSSSPSALPSTSAQLVTSVLDFKKSCFVCVTAAEDNFIAKQTKVPLKNRPKVFVLKDNTL